MNKLDMITALYCRLPQEDALGGDSNCNFYAKDTSKKIRVVLKSKGMSGEHLGQPLYEYMKNPDDKKLCYTDFR